MQPDELQPGETLAFELPATPARRLPRGAIMQLDFDCSRCGAHYHRTIEPIYQIVAVDCRCGERIELTIDPPPVEPAPARVHHPARPGRNSPCPCGSGRKFKKCCRANPHPPAPQS